MSSPEAQASLIGVAIACSGNVLISLALTIQKLAHQRREEHSKEHGFGHHDAHAASPARTPLRRGHVSHGAITPSPINEEAEALCASLELESDNNNNDTYNGIRKSAVKGDTLQPAFSPTSTPSPSSPSLSPSPTHRAPSPTEAGYLRSRLWWLGLGLMALGEFGNFLSYGFAPASVIAPLGTVALIANCVFAPVVLGESFTRRNVLGVVLAIIGAVTVVWSSRDDNKRLSPDELVEAITALPFVIYTAINIVVASCLTWLSSSPWGDKYIGVDVGLCALCGGYTVMATKALSSLLSTKLILALEYPIAWGAIAVLLVTSVLQIKFLNRALMRFESKEVIPTQFVFFSLSAIVGSAVLYQEFRGVSRSDFVNFAFGIATTFLGVYFLTTPSDNSPMLDDEESRLLATPDRPSYTLNASTATTTTSGSTPHIGISPLLLPQGAQTGPGFRPSSHSRRPSTPNVDISHALNSPGAFFLLATTPPVSTLTTPATAVAHVRQDSTSRGSRTRSASRGNVHRVLESLARR